MKKTITTLLLSSLLLPSFSHAESQLAESVNNQTAQPASSFQQALSSSADRNTAKSSLTNLLKEIDFFSASFKQQVLDESGSLLQEGQGTLVVKKPNLVNWQTQSPDELSIISDGTDIWFYDPFIEQASVYTFDFALTNTPILLLTSDDSTLWDKFNVSAEVVNNTESSVNKQELQVDKQLRYVIQAKDDNSQIKRLIIDFSHTGDTNATIKRFTFEDATGQSSVIELNEFDLRTQPVANLFSFSLPQGATLDDQR